MIEELVILGGGYGLFTGCAAGDTGTNRVFGDPIRTFVGIELKEA